MNTYSINVQNVSFVIEAEDADDALYEVQSALEEIAIDWTEPLVEA